MERVKLRNGVFTDEGIWLSQQAARSGRAVPGLIMDRDGVVVVEVHYLHRREDVRLEAGAASLLAWANRAGVPVAVATNQAGIARGLFGWPDFEAVEEEIERALSAEGARVDLVLASPFHPEHTPGWSDAHGHWRKPGPGMLQLAARLLNLDPARSWMIGDTESDIAAARAAGLAGGVHVLTGHGRNQRAQALRLATENFEVLAADDPGEALTLLKPRLGAV